MGKTTKGSFTRTVLQVKNRIEKSHSSTLPRPRKKAQMRFQGPRKGDRLQKNAMQKTQCKNALQKRTSKSVV
jgi:hypothetical protein